MSIVVALDQANEYIHPHMGDRNENLREVREALGISQVVLAKLFGIHVMTVSRWECGVMEPHGIYPELIVQLSMASKKKDAGKRIGEALRQYGVSAGLRALLEETRP